MKQYILPKEGNFYKANLHCHSTCSDGKLTVEELKEIYKSNGYSVLAYSDHNVLVDHSDLDDENFLAFTSCEYDVNKKGDRGYAFRACYHLNVYPPHQHHTALPCFNPKYVWGKREDLRDAQEYIGTPDFQRDYENINDMIAEFNKQGFLVMANHPTWSQQTLDDYRNVEGLFAMEMYNNGCYTEGYDEFNGQLYDALLRSGHKLWCTATDDNHNFHPMGTPRWDSCGGFTMIKAKELTYDAILDALKKGDFYASTGPEIKELYIEDDQLHVKTSPASRITVTTAVRSSRVANPAEGEDTLCEAVFDLSRFYPGYFRITVEDGKGHFAWSQPVFGEFSGRQE